MKRMSKGFTLIEMMIVVAIIAIIAAVAIPNLLQSRIAANETSAITSVKAYATAQETFKRGAFSRRDILGEAGGAPGGALTAVPRPQYADPRRAYYAHPWTDLHWVDNQVPGNPGPTAHISFAMANATGPENALNGYFFLQPPLQGREASMTEYAPLFALPAQHGITGTHIFFISQAGVIFRKDAGGQVNSLDDPRIAGASSPPHGHGWAFASGL